MLHYHIKHNESGVIIDYLYMENSHTQLYLCTFFLSCDFVELTNISGQRIDRLSGFRSGFTVTVRGDRTTLLRIRFTTDFSITRQGFKAQYSITFGE